MLEIIIVEHYFGVISIQFTLDFVLKKKKKKHAQKFVPLFINRRLVTVPSLCFYAQLNCSKGIKPVMLSPPKGCTEAGKRSILINK